MHLPQGFHRCGLPILIYSHARVARGCLPNTDMPITARSTMRTCRRRETLRFKRKECPAREIAFPHVARPLSPRGGHYGTARPKHTAHHVHGASAIPNLKRGDLHSLRVLPSTYYARNSAPQPGIQSPGAAANPRKMGIRLARTPYSTCHRPPFWLCATLLVRFRSRSAFCRLRATSWSMLVFVFTPASARGATV